MKTTTVVHKRLRRLVEYHHRETVMSPTPGIRMKNPTHPGGFVRSEIIEALALSVTDAAQALGVTRPALSALLNERARLSPEMALRIEKAFGVSMDTLMRMQSSFDIAQARKRAGEIDVPPYKGKPLDPRPWRNSGPRPRSSAPRRLP